ncbi:MAG: OB-fold domain-containing protein [Rhodococcus fascians]
MAESRGHGAVAVERSLPVIEKPAEDYWEGARRHRLVIQRCDECRTWIHPPRFVCPTCQSFDLRGEPASGRGTLYAWSVQHMRGVPGFPPPYVVVVVELDEQPGLLAIGNLSGGGANGLRLGAPMEVVFEDLTDEVTLPQWRMTES